MSEDKKVNVLIAAALLSAGIGMFRPPTWVGAIVLAVDVVVAVWALRAQGE